MKRTVTIFHRICVVGLLVASAFARPLRAGPAAGEGPDHAPSLAFGAKIIDIALTLDDAARQSLVKAPETDVPARMSFNDASGVEVTYVVQIRIKGQSGSRRSINGKPAFKVKLGADDRFFGLEHLTLNNMVQDQTMMHEAIGYQVYEAAGVTVPATGYARVTVNGQAYGLYLNLETPDAHFLRRRFGDDSGILYEGAYGVDLRAGDVAKFQLHEGKDADRATLKALVRALDAPGDDIFYGPSPQVDSASFLGMMAAEALLGDWDSYYTSNNYRIYWNPSASRWFFIPTGIDQSFKGTTVFGGTGLLFQKCLASERCTKDYADKVRDVASRFEGLDLPGKMDALLPVIDEASQADPKNKYNASSMTHARKVMRTFIAGRPNEMRAALSCADGGSDAGIGACAGGVVVNAATRQCLEVPSGKAGQNGTAARASRCTGGASQRWRRVALGEGVEIVPASGASIDSQRFGLQPVSQGTQLVATSSGACIAVMPNHSKGAAVTEVTCANTPAQTWRVQRSIYE